MLDAKAFHYDSLHPLNHSVAAQISDRLSAIAGLKPLKFVDLESPQQGDGSGSEGTAGKGEEGIHACVLMRHLLRRILGTPREGKVNLGMNGKVISVAGARREVLRLVWEVRQEMVGGEVG